MRAPTIKQLAARHVRRLRTMREKLLEMSKEWDDLDQFNMGQLEALSDSCEEVARDMVDGKDDEERIL